MIGLFLSLCMVFFINACSSGSEIQADCDPHAGPCMKTSGPYTVTLDISPKPVRHMQELLFEASVSGGSPLFSADTLLLDLSMPGMEMGKNEVTLRKAAENLYRGTGVIVKCLSGRTLWRATLSISETLKPSFTFNVRE